MTNDEMQKGINDLFMRQRLWAKSGQPVCLTHAEADLIRQALSKLNPILRSKEARLVGKRIGITDGKTSWAVTVTGFDFDFLYSGDKAAWPIAKIKEYIFPWGFDK